MDDDNNIVEFTPARIARMKNLKPYRNKTDGEILEILKARAVNGPTKRSRRKDNSYDARFEEKMKILQQEFALDMNNSNDVENLKVLVRHQLQLENVNHDIDDVQRKDKLTVEDYRTLKNLGDFQRSLIMSVNELQDKLGISRKIRKERANDDVPQWIDGVLDRAKAFYDRKTTKIECPKCKIELGRFWLNFPNLKNDIEVSLQCWKCEELVEYIE